MHTPASVLTLWFAGQPAITGASPSFTVTLKVHVFSLPLLSVAVQVTVVTPLLKVEPLTGLQTTDATAQLSLAVGAVQFTTAAHRPASVFCVMLAGQGITGFSVSLTVTSNWQLPLLPAASLAVQVTCVVPLGKAEPLPGLQATVTLPSQLSVAVGA